MTVLVHDEQQHRKDMQAPTSHVTLDRVGRGVTSMWRGTATADPEWTTGALAVVLHSAATLLRLSNEVNHAGPKRFVKLIYGIVAGPDGGAFLPADTGFPLGDDFIDIVPTEDDPHLPIMSDSLVETLQYICKAGLLGAAAEEWWTATEDENGLSQPGLYPAKVVEHLSFLVSYIIVLVYNAYS